MYPVEVKEGQDAKFQCRIFGKPVPLVEWYKDDVLIENDDKEFSFQKQDGCEILIVHEVSPLDEAEYKVLARNTLGTATSLAELFVEEEEVKPEFIEPMKDVQVVGKKFWTQTVHHS